MTPSEYTDPCPGCGSGAYCTIPSYRRCHACGFEDHGLQESDEVPGDLIDWAKRAKAFLEEVGPAPDWIDLAVAMRDIARDARKEERDKWT